MITGLTQTYRRHRQAAEDGVRRLCRNRVETALSLALISVVIGFAGVLMLTLQQQRTLNLDWRTEPSIVVFLRREIEASIVEHLSNEVAGRPEVAAVERLSGALAYAEFAASLGLQDESELYEELPDLLIVHLARNTSRTQIETGIIPFIQKHPAVGSLMADPAWHERLAAALKLVERIVLSTGSLLACGVVLSIASVLRGTMRKESLEIIVLTMVGATRGYIRRSYLYSGALLGFTAGLVGALVPVLIAAALSAPAAELAQSYGSAYRLEPLTPADLALLIGGSTVAGWAGAWVSLFGDSAFGSDQR